MCSIKVEDNQRYWVALNLVLAENLRAAKKIADHFPHVREAFETSSENLVALGIEEDKARRIASSKILDQASREIERIEKKKYLILSLHNKGRREGQKLLLDTLDIPYSPG